MCENSIFNVPLRGADPSTSGVTAFFVLQLAVLTAQALWICELTDNRWKQIPGSICILPQVVPISQIVSELLPSLPLFICSSVWVSATVISDTILISAPLMVRQASPAGPGYLSLTNLDREGSSRPGVALPFIFHLLRVDRHNTGVSGARYLGDSRARYLGSNFRCGEVHSPTHTTQSP